MKVILNSLLIGLLLIISISNSKGQNSNSDEYLSAGDAVRVQIWDLLDVSSDRNKSPFSNLSNDYVINSDGNITMPFVGLIRVEGKLSQEVSMIIREKFKDFLKEPFIFVRPLIRVTVAGSVAKPGSYRIDPKSSLWDLLDLAGGPETEADLKKIHVKRGGEKKIESLLQAFENAYSLEEVGIRSGDQIVIPANNNFSLRDVISYLNFATSIALLYLRLRRY